MLDGIAKLLGVTPQAAGEGFMTTKISVGNETIYKPLGVQKVGFCFLCLLCSPLCLLACSCARVLARLPLCLLACLLALVSGGMLTIALRPKSRAMPWPKQSTTACSSGW